MPIRFYLIKIGRRRRFYDFHYFWIGCYEIAKLVKSFAIRTAKTKTSYFVLFDCCGLNFNAMKFSVMAKCYPIARSTYR